MNAHTRRILKQVILYIAGLFATFVCIGFLTDLAFIPFLIAAIAALIQLPFTYKFLSGKFEISLKTIHRLTAGFVLIIVGFVLFNPAQHLDKEVTKSNQVVSPQRFVTQDATANGVNETYVVRPIQREEKPIYLPKKKVKKKHESIQAFTTTYKPKKVKRTQTYSSYNSSTGSHECHAITRKGTRCLRMVANGYNCWQHGG